MDFLYLYIVVCIIIIIYIIYKDKIVKIYYNYFKIRRKGEKVIIENLTKYLGRHVLIESLSSKHYGELVEVTDTLVILTNNQLKKIIIKDEFIISAEIYKEKKKKKNKE